MSLSRETMMELMALADGELDGEDRERVEKLAAESDEARRVVEAMRAPVLGAWLAGVMVERSAAADGIADRVMAELELEVAKKDGVAGGGQVVRLSEARRTHRAPTGVTRGQLAVLGGALVLAAVILLYVRSDHEADTSSPVANVEPPAPVPSATVPAAMPAAPATTALAQAPHPTQGVEVDEIDSPSHDVTVFEIPGGNMAAAASGNSPSSVVIMIEDEPVKP
jgi:hypothetical protein